MQIVNRLKYLVIRSLFYIIAACFCLSPFNVNAQGIIINEVSNGTGSDHPTLGGREFVELLVIGDPGNPTAPVDLTGWIIDDNNGDFEGSFGTGVSDGHVQITGTCLNNVMPGTLIVLYNDANPNPNVPADDITDANGDNVYIFPISNACFQSCTTAPTTFNTGYGCGALGAANWITIGLANAGDAIQTRQPGGAFFHGFSYGNVTGTFPTFPDGSTSFNVGLGGTGSHFEFQCGNWNAVSQIQRTSASLNETPGVSNVLGGANENATTIRVLERGLYDYANLNNPDNCGLILNAEIPFFEIEQENDHISLSWKGVAGEKTEFIVERSLEGGEFQQIASYNELRNVYEHQDFELGQGYHHYRIRQVLVNGQSTLSETRSVWIGHNQFKVYPSFPNPGKDMFMLRISSKEEGTTSFRILDSQGKLVKSLQVLTHAGVNIVEFDAKDFAEGLYVIFIQSDRGARILQRWVKE